jgi:hypothetical protein
VPQLAEFHETYGTMLARELEVEPAPSWLPGGSGLVLEADVPARVFSLRTDGVATIRTFEGIFRVRAVDETTPLAAVPFELARPALARSLRNAARGDAYHVWTARTQNDALDQIRCLRDRLPAVGAVELASFLPYLTLDESV